MLSVQLAGECEGAPAKNDPTASREDRKADRPSTREGGGDNYSGV